MRHRDRKFEYLAKRQGWTCPIWELWALRTKGRRRKLGRTIRGPFGTIRLVAMGGPQLSDLHHRLHNTKVNRRCFPLFIDSMLNLVAVSHAWHLQRPHYGRISEYTARRMERTLQRWPRARAFVNGETGTLDWRTT